MRSYFECPRENIIRIEISIPKERSTTFMSYLISDITPKELQEKISEMKRI